MDLGLISGDKNFRKHKKRNSKTTEKRLVNPRSKQPSWHSGFNRFNRKSKWPTAHRLKSEGQQVAALRVSYFLCLRHFLKCLAIKMTKRQNVFSNVNRVGACELGQVFLAGRKLTLVALYKSRSPKNTLWTSSLKNHLISQYWLIQKCLRKRGIQ